MLGKRARPAADADPVAELEEAASAARLFGQVEAAVAGTSSRDALQNGLEPGEQPRTTLSCDTHLCIYSCVPKCPFCWDCNTPTEAG